MVFFTTASVLKKTSPKLKKLIILDRDGVINQDSDSYIKSPEEWIPIPGSLEAIASLKLAGWKVAVATNQSGLARGLFDQSTLNAIHTKMHRELLNHNTNIDYLVWCPHGPDDMCACRKPKPGLYRQISRYFRVELTDVPVVGDSSRDLIAAASVGARPILVRTGKGNKTLSNEQLPQGSSVYANLSEVAKSLRLE